MQALLTVLVTWLSVNLGLPAIHEHPRIETVSTAKMAAVRYSRLGVLQQDRVAAKAGRSAPAEIGHDVVAIYDDLTRTIYLHEKWTGETARDVSVLVHELVHHLQNVGKLEYECPEAREKPAYRAQARWLELFGKNLADEFDLDPMTLLVRTNCMR
jgi:hypothetical protein